MSRTRQYVKKQAKAITRRRLGAKERHERQQKRAQRDIEALHQALDDLGLPDDLVTEIEGRLRTQKKLLGKIFHIPPNLVVGRCRRTLIASRREDLQVEHPVRGREAPALYFHPTLARVQGPALVRDQVVQMRQAGEKRRVTPTGMV